MMIFGMKFKKTDNEEFLDYTLVPSGLLIMVIYHIWLVILIRRKPILTVIGHNRVSRRHWVFHMMSDPQKNGILAIQTLRNNMMASTLLATISITLSSLISAVVSRAGETLALTYTIHTVKYFSILVCFLTAFLCSMQCVRYYAHVSFLINVPSPKGPAAGQNNDGFVEFVAQKLNMGSLFWSLALRAFYFSFPLLLWIFGPVAMFTCSCFMAFLLYFLDTVNPASESLPNGYVDDYTKPTTDEESGAEFREATTTVFEDSNLYTGLLRSSKIASPSNATLK